VIVIDPSRGRSVLTVERRRQRAAELTRLLSGNRAVSPPFVPHGTVSSWWLFMVQVHEAGLGVTTREFGEALQEEGEPAWVRYHKVVRHFANAEVSR
jgi:dTDP-4-amino-4,6-dideoxygalactose transaminase